MKIIGVVGSRRRNTGTDFSLVEKAFLEHYVEGDFICSGLCSRGADRFATIIQRKYNIIPLWFPAEWDKYGKQAGFIRNTDIAENSDMLIACIAPDRAGGTEDTITKFTSFHPEGLLIIV